MTSWKFLILGFVLLLIAALIECVRINSPDRSDWESFRRFHGKRYRNPEEQEEARKTFEENRRVVQEHNRLYREGKVNNKRELNKFSDWSKEKFRARNTARVPPKVLASLRKEQRRRKRLYGSQLPLAGLDLSPPPAQFDWRNVNGVNYVTPVKSQGDCGDCYAFSAIGVLESQVLIRKNPERSFSEEQIADCIYLDNNAQIQWDAPGSTNGCDGGWQPDVWQYIMDVGGVTTEDTYPYTLGKSENSKPCTFKASMGNLQKVASYSKLTAPTDEELKQLLINKGPLGVLINADSGIQWHDTGIDSNTNMTVDHAVILVGYATDENQQDYWIIKNSWGHDWGDDGFIHLNRDRTKNAGLTGSGSLISWVDIP